MKSLILLLLMAAVCLAACDDKPKALTESFSEYGVNFRLPEDWQKDEFGRIGMNVFGGYGYAAPDYEGVSYLRLHQGSAIAIIGDWDREADAATVLESSFARDISEPESITVLGHEGSYAHGLIDQGQGIGAIHVIIEKGGEQHQFILLGVVADKWEVFEPTFLEIAKSLSFAE